MVKSKFTRIAVFRIVISLTLLIIVLLVTVALSASVFFGSPILKRDNSPILLVATYIGLFYIFIFIAVKSLLKRALIIEINTQEKEIKFKSVVTFRSCRYRFEQFDSYFDVQMNNKAGNYPEAYLVKNRKVEKIICGLYLANYDELLGALNSLTYKGRIRRTSKLSMSLFFNRNIDVD